jgi:biopolymer transport protein ExbB
MLKITRLAMLAAALVAGLPSVMLPTIALAQAQPAAPAPAAPAATSDSPAVVPAAPVAPAPAPAPKVGEKTTEVVENPYGLEALWKGGDLVARLTLGILAIMSMGSW